MVSCVARDPRKVQLGIACQAALFAHAPESKCPRPPASEPEFLGTNLRMDAFRFSPELFDLCGDVTAMLDRAGYQWLSHYSSVGCLHDLYGVEVCGIHEEEDAIVIRELLIEMFPDWIHGCVYHKDYGIEPGWEGGEDSQRQTSSGRELGGSMIQSAANWFGWRFTAGVLLLSSRRPPAGESKAAKARACLRP